MGKLFSLLQQLFFPKSRKILFILICSICIFISFSDNKGINYKHIFSVGVNYASIWLILSFYKQWKKFWKSGEEKEKKELHLRNWWIELGIIVHVILILKHLINDELYGEVEDSRFYFMNNVLIVCLLDISLVSSFGFKGRLMIISGTTIFLSIVGYYGNCIRECVFENNAEAKSCFTKEFLELKEYSLLNSLVCGSLLWKLGKSFSSKILDGQSKKLSLSLYKDLCGTISEIVEEGLIIMNMKTSHILYSNTIVHKLLIPEILGSNQFADKKEFLENRVFNELRIQNPKCQDSEPIIGELLKERPFCSVGEYFTTNKKEKGAIYPFMNCGTNKYCFQILFSSPYQTLSEKQSFPLLFQSKYSRIKDQWKNITILRIRDQGEEAYQYNKYIFGDPEKNEEHFHPAQLDLDNLASPENPLFPHESSNEMNELNSFDSQNQYNVKNYSSTANERIGTAYFGFDESRKDLNFRKVDTFRTEDSCDFGENLEKIESLHIEDKVFVSKQNNVKFRNGNQNLNEPLQITSSSFNYSKNFSLDPTPASHSNYLQKESMNCSEDSFYTPSSKDILNLQAQIKQKSDIISNMKKKLKTSNIYLNMVVHDLRAPVLSLEGALDTIAQFLHLHNTDDEKLQKIKTFGGYINLQSDKKLHSGLEKELLEEPMKTNHKNNALMFSIKNSSADLLSSFNSFSIQPKTKIGEVWKRKESSASSTHTKNIGTQGICSVVNPINECSISSASITSAVIENIQHSPKSLSKKEQLELVFKAAKVCSFSLTNLINDLLDNAKLENCSFSLYQENTNILELVKTTKQMLSFQAHLKQIKIKTDFGIESTQEDQMFYLKKVYIDPNRFRQVLINLITNAIKFTPQGGTITIKVRIFCLQEISSHKYPNLKMNTPEVKPGSFTKVSAAKLKAIKSCSMEFRGENIPIELVCEIKDTGVGISENNLDKLFLDFSKLDENTHLNKIGTGLGLSICRRIINSMNGKIKVKSSKGKGTTFQFTLETFYNYQLPPITVIHHPIPKRTEIKVELNPTFMNLEEDKSDNDDLNLSAPNIVDNQLLNRSFKSSKSETPYKRRKTDNAILSVRKGLFNLECHDSSTFKPINITKGYESPTKTQVKDSLRKKNANEIKVIIVDDADYDRNIVKSQVLKRTSFVKDFDNGDDAIKIVQEEDYDLIFLDLSMPRKTGIETCQEINDIFRRKAKLSRSRRYSQINHPQILGNPMNDHVELSYFKPLMVAVSSYSKSYASSNCWEVGFDFYIERPLKSDMIDYFLKLCEY